MVDITTSALWLRKLSLIKVVTCHRTHCKWDECPDLLSSNSLGCFCYFFSTLGCCPQSLLQLESLEEHINKTDNSTI